MAAVPEDDDREGQQRLRLPISGAVSSLRAAHTCACFCRVSCFKERIETDRTSALLSFLPFYCRVKLVLFKAST